LFNFVQAEYRLLKQIIQVSLHISKLISTKVTKFICLIKSNVLSDSKQTLKQKDLDFNASTDSFNVTVIVLNVLRTKYGLLIKYLRNWFKGLECSLPANLRRPILRNRSARLFRMVLYGQGKVSIHFLFLWNKTTDL